LKLDRISNQYEVSRYRNRRASIERLGQTRRAVFAMIAFPYQLTIPSQGISHNIPDAAGLQKILAGRIIVFQRA
jgi:hypothetical protein